MHRQAGLWVRPISDGAALLELRCEHAASGAVWAPGEWASFAEFVLELCNRHEQACGQPACCARYRSRYGPDGARQRLQQGRRPGKLAGRPKLPTRRSSGNGARRM